MKRINSGYKLCSSLVEEVAPPTQTVEFRFGAVVFIEKMVIYMSKKSVDIYPKAESIVPFI